MKTKTDDFAFWIITTLLGIGMVIFLVMIMQTILSPINHALTK